MLRKKIRKEKAISIPSTGRFDGKSVPTINVNFPIWVNQTISLTNTLHTGFIPMNEFKYCLKVQ